MEIGLFGAFRVVAATGPIAIPRRRERCLLAVLLLSNGRPVSVERLAHLLWDGKPPSTARQQIHSHVSRLRGLLRGAPVELHRSGDWYRIEAGADTVDVQRFQVSVTAARAATEHREKLLRAALDLWTGEPLEDSASQWLRDQLFDELRSLWAAATEEWLECRIDSGHAAEVVPDILRLAAAEPDREALLGLLMRAYQSAGRPADALRVFAQYRQRLAEEFGTEPGTALQRLNVEVLRLSGRLSEESGLARAASTPEGQPVVCPVDLPVGAAVFVGRRNELGSLDALVEPGERWAPAIAVIRGPGGAGKTALALRWAWSVRERYPGGQLYADLRGFSSDPRAVPADVLRGFLLALGVRADHMPPTLQALITLYRSLLATRRMLIVLDNAGDTAQVEPLLPAGPDCAVVITSRLDLPELVALHDAIPIRVGPLPNADSLLLLTRCLGPDLAGDRTALARLAALCGHLPLALRVAVANIRDGRPGRLQAYLERLDGLGRLDALRLGHDPGLALRTTFDLSYAALDVAVQRVFRLLGAAPVADVSLLAAAALIGAPVDTAESLLERLVQAHLLEEPQRGRYRLHDLLKEYAQERCVQSDSAEERHAAILALTDFYVHAAASAAVTIRPRYRSPLVVDDSTIAIPVFADPHAVFAWFQAEHSNLRTLIRHADECGWYTAVGRLATASSAYFEITSMTEDFLDVQSRARSSAIITGDRPAAAWASYLLGGAYWLTGNHTEARSYVEEAERIFKQVGDLPGEAMALRGLGVVAADTGQLRLGLDQVTRALELLNTHGLASDDVAIELHSALCTLHMLNGEYQAALAHGRIGLRMARQSGRTGQHRITFVLLNELGRTHRRMGHRVVAVALLRRAYAEQDAFTGSRGRAEFLVELGIMARADGRLAEAVSLHREGHRLASASGYFTGRCQAQNELGLTLTAIGLTEEAEHLHRAVLADAVRTGHRQHAAAAHEGIAAAIAHRDTDAARQHLSDALDTYRDLHLPEKDRVVQALERLPQPVADPARPVVTVWRTASPRP